MPAGDEEVRGLTQDTLTLSDQPSPGAELEPYNPQRKQESVRAWVTGALLGALIALLFFAGIVASTGSKEHWDETKEMLQILLPAVTGLLGSALGFYFGTQSKKD
jgi:hypothetical protein